MFLVLLAVSLTGLRGASETEEKARRVVQKIQPAALALMELEGQVNRAAASMGFYLKSGEEGHKALYLKDNRKLATTLATTGNALQSLGDESVLQVYSDLAAKVKQFSSYATRILELTDSDLNNMPVMALAEQSLNPRHMEILQALGEMLTSEQEAQEEAISDLASETLSPPEYDFAEQQRAIDPALLDALKGRVGVLADEVRSLASRTRDSTEEIQGMIESLQQASREAVSVMDTGQEQARDTVAHADGTRQSLEEILRSVSTISDTSGSIASASVQQSHGVDQIDKTIVSISEVAEQTNQGARELEGSSAELGATAARLQELISTFKTA